MRSVNIACPASFPSWGTIHDLAHRCCHPGIVFLLARVVPPPKVQGDARSEDQSMTINRAVEPECASAKVLKSRPHPSLLRVISRKGKHPGRAHRIKRWHRYRVGMSLLHCRETAGLDHLDVLYYAKHGLMTLRPMTAEERREALRRWDADGATSGDPVQRSIEDDKRMSSVTCAVSPAAPAVTLRNPDVRNIETCKKLRAYYDNEKKARDDWREARSLLKLGGNVFIGTLKILAALGAFARR